MTDKQLKNLKDTLWETADQLRANSGLKSTEYAEPILGLIFLRFADVKYSKFEKEITAEYQKTKGSRMERPLHEIAIAKCGFHLPQEARLAAIIRPFKTAYISITLSPNSFAILLRKDTIPWCICSSDAFRASISSRYVPANLVDRTYSPNCVSILSV